MKIGFTGTREGMTKAQLEELRKLVLSMSIIMEAHHGDCAGSDEQFASIMKRRAVKVVSHPPVNKKYRSFAYFTEIREAKDYLDRNRNIVDATDVLFATPKEMTEQARGGTWYTIRYAAKCGKPVWIILPNGEIVRGVTTSPPPSAPSPSN